MQLLALALLAAVPAQPDAPRFEAEFCQLFFEFLLFLLQCFMLAREFVMFRFLLTKPLFDAAPRHPIGGLSGLRVERHQTVVVVATLDPDVDRSVWCRRGRHRDLDALDGAVSP